MFRNRRRRPRGHELGTELGLIAIFAGGRIAIVGIRQGDGWDSICHDRRTARASVKQKRSSHPGAVAQLANDAEAWLPWRRKTRKTGDPEHEVSPGG